MKRNILTIILAALALLAATAKPIDDAKALYNEGQYEQAIEKLKAIIKGSPKDGTANYYLGMSYLALGDTEQAIAPLKIAESKSIANASKALTQIAIDRYRMDDASEHIASWEKILKKDKKSIPDELNVMRSQIVLTKNMLERVEKIRIVDSIVVDSAQFFKHYRLSKEAGKLLDGNVLSPRYAAMNPRVVFEPENNKEVFWAMPSDSGALMLAGAQILDDGTFESPTFLGDVLNDGGDADFPFFSSDGVTFYFANNGENSLGGYDIFLSRRNSDGSVLQPQNMGMPYNSAYDDYMLVIDDAANLGWWATDRNQIPGKVTIYVFIPNEIRENYDPDDPDLADYAFIKSIAATRNPDAIANNPALSGSRTPTQGNAASQFRLSMGNGKVYTSLADFKNPAAAQAMQQYLDREKDLKQMQTQLEILRMRYADGDRSVANDIISLEKRILAAAPLMKRLRNQAVQQESR